jgi:hypothetical protein
MITPTVGEPRNIGKIIDSILAADLLAKKQYKGYCPSSRTLAEYVKTTNSLIQQVSKKNLLPDRADLWLATDFKYEIMKRYPKIIFYDSTKEHGMSKFFAICGRLISRIFGFKWVDLMGQPEEQTFRDDLLKVEGQRYVKGKEAMRCQKFFQEYSKWLNEHNAQDLKGHAKITHFSLSFEGEGAPVIILKQEGLPVARIECRGARYTFNLILAENLGDNREGHNISQEKYPTFEYLHERLKNMGFNFSQES